jgi:hypothetical protein
MLIYVYKYLYNLCINNVNKEENFIHPSKKFHYDRNAIQ